MPQVGDPGRCPKPVDRLLRKLADATRSGNGWAARCPAHKDRKASLSVSEGDDGAALVHCHAGCELAEILAAVGLKPADLFPAKPGQTPPRNDKPKPGGQSFPTADEAVAHLESKQGDRSALWEYHDAAGNLVGLVVRWDLTNGKDIRPVSLHSDGWRVGAMPDPRPLYGLPDLANADLVIVTEGEKAADAARELGFVATTSAGGSNAPQKSDWEPLAGKEVLLLPDNDLAGRKYAETVAGILARLTPDPVVKVVELPDLPDKGDIVDWIEGQGEVADPDAMRAEIEALGEAVEPWLPPESDDLTFRRFPVDALPEPVRGYVADGAKAIGCDTSYLALPLLTALASAIGNTRRLQLKRGWLAPPIIWSVIVGYSGTLKSPAFKRVMRPVFDRQDKAFKRHEERMQQYEAELARWEEDGESRKRSNDGTEDMPSKPSPPAVERLVVNDTTVEALAPILRENPRGLLLANDELAAWIGSFDRYAGKGKVGTDAPKWLSMFNADTIVVDRKTGHPRTIHVKQAAVCVAGGIQPEILRRGLGKEHRESGLAARLLLSWPPSEVKKWTDAGIDPKAEAVLDELFDRLYGLEPHRDADGETRPALVGLTPEARVAWIDYYNAHAEELADLTGDLAAAWAKLEEYAARLALVIHFIRWAADDSRECVGKQMRYQRVDVDSMKAGIRLAQWFKHEARRVYAMLDETEGESENRKLVEWITKQGRSVTAREVQQGCRWLREAGAAETALEGLVKAGRGTWESSPAGQRGQPTRRFELNTVTTVYGNA